MKKYIPLIIISLVLTSCNFNWNNKLDSFQKKQECAKYYNEAKDIENSFSNSWGYFKTENIFYSKKNNSCLFAYENWDLKDWSYWFLIEDLFSKEMVYTSWLVNSKNEEAYNMSETSWKNKIKELKWE